MLTLDPYMHNFSVARLLHFDAHKTALRKMIETQRAWRHYAEQESPPPPPNVESAKRGPADSNLSPMHSSLR